MPTLSKVLEKILCNELLEHLENFDTLPKNQSSFSALHCWTTALLAVTDDIIAATDRDNLTFLVLLDYTKAFDWISYDILIAAWHHIGFNRNSLNLMHCYSHFYTDDALNNKNLCLSHLARSLGQYFDVDLRFDKHVVVQRSVKKIEWGISFITYELCRCCLEHLLNKNTRPTLVKDSK